MVGAVDRFIDAQRTLVGRSRSRQFPQVLQHGPQVVDVPRDIRMVGAVDRFIDAQRTLVGRPRAGVVGHHVEMVAEVVPEGRGGIDRGDLGGKSGGLGVGAQRDERGRQESLGGLIGEGRKRAGQGGEGLVRSGQGAGVLGQEGVDGWAGGGLVHLEQTQAGEDGKGGIAGVAVKVCRRFQHLAGYRLVGGAVTGDQEGAACLLIG